MRALTIAFAMLAVACTPPAQAPSGEAPATAGQAGQAAEAPDPERDAMVDALSAPAGVEIGLPVTFEVTTKRVEGEWGWLVAQPWTREGAQIDWSQTRYAQRAADGVLDGGGTTYALLRKQNGTWSVVAFAVGPTDVAYADWPQHYGAPASVMGLE
jgi:hypothetical protein